MPGSSRQISLGLAQQFLPTLANIRRGEGIGTSIFFVYGFLLLNAYYLLKPVREALILSQFGAEIRSYSIAVIAVLLVLLVPVYGRLFRKLGPQRLTLTILSFFIVTLLLLAGLGAQGHRIGFWFYVWQGIFSVTTVAQFWALAADTYRPASGKRLFPIIAAGVSLGACSGSWLAKVLYPVAGAYGLMLTSACLLGLTLYLVHLVHSTQCVPGAISDKSRSTARACARGGYSLIASNRYLLLIAMSVVFLNWINSTGEFILAGSILNYVANDTEITSHADRAMLIGTIYGHYFSAVTVLSLLVQLFLVSHLFRAIGVPATYIALPIIMVIGYLTLSFVPIFSVIFVYMALENTGNYSFHNTARHALFLSVGQAERFEGKTAIDTVFWRFGDLAQAATVFVGSGYFHFSISAFALMNLALAIPFVWVTVAARRMHAANAVSTTPSIQITKFRHLISLRRSAGEAAAQIT